MCNERLACAVSLFALSSAGASAAHGLNWPNSRNPALWPFSAASPWNTPINNGAIFAPITAPVWQPPLPGQSPTYNLGINVYTNTTSVVLAQRTNNAYQLYDNQFLIFPGQGIDATYQYNNSVWYSEHAPLPPEAPGPQTWCQPLASEDVYNFFYNSVFPTQAGLEANYPNNSPFPHNPWSKARGGFKNIGANYNTMFQMPENVCGSPDSDGWTSVVPPSKSHFAVDLYAPVVITSKQNVITGQNIVIAHAIGSYYDIEGDGSGIWNGRRASMIPTLAGLIRTGEIAGTFIPGGFIPHALAAVIGPDMLTNLPGLPAAKDGSAWPAWAYDTSTPYANCAGCLHMGALLAIPSTVKLSRLHWQTNAGYVAAVAAQTYGIYIVATGTAGSMNILAELNNPDIPSTGYDDLQQIRKLLQVVKNNAPAHPGGPGTPYFGTQKAPAFTY